MKDYNFKITEVLQFILEPVQRQNNIILSLSSWLTGAQQIANTFSQNVIPNTTYLGNINSSKGAFEWYLNNEFNIATYSAYQPIFIDTLQQRTLAMYGYNNQFEFEYEPLYFLQGLPGFFDGVNSVVSYYSNAATYSSQKMVKYGTLNIVDTFQNFGTQSVPINTPPVVGSSLANRNIWQLATYGFNDLNSQLTSSDYDFVVYVPIYLCPTCYFQNIGDFGIQIRAYIEKYKLAHLTYIIQYY